MKQNRNSAVREYNEKEKDNYPNNQGPLQCSACNEDSVTKMSRMWSMKNAPGCITRCLQTSLECHTTMFLIRNTFVSIVPELFLYLFCLIHLKTYMHKTPDKFCSKNKLPLTIFQYSLVENWNGYVSIFTFIVYFKSQLFQFF